MAQNRGKYAGCNINQQNNEVAALEIETNNNKSDNSQRVGGQGLGLPPPNRPRARNNVGSQSQATGSNPLPAPSPSDLMSLNATELAQLKARAIFQATIAAANAAMEKHSNLQNGNGNGNGNGNMQNSGNWVMNEKDLLHGLINNDCVSKNLINQLSICGNSSLLSKDQEWFKNMQGRPDNLNCHLRTNSGGSLPSGSVPPEFPFDVNSYAIQQEMAKLLEYGPARGCNQFHGTLKRAANGFENGIVNGSLLSAVAQQHRDNVQREKQSNEQYLKNKDKSSQNKDQN